MHVISSGNFALGSATSTQNSAPVRLHYACCGDPGKPLMMLLHGFPEFWYAYADVMPLLAEQYFVVAPDLRGFNLSDKPAAVESYKPALVIADILAIASCFSAKPFHLVAHDWGGAIGWSLAIAHADRLQSLSIVNAPHPIPFASALATDPAQQQASQYMNWLRAKGSEVPLLENQCARLVGFFRGPESASTAAWFTDAVKAEYIRAWQQRGAMTGGVNYYRASPLYPPTENDEGARRLQLDAAKFRVLVPTQILWGDADVALLPILLEGIEELVPGVQIERWPDGSHWVLHEHPRRCAEHLLAHANQHQA